MAGPVSRTSKAQVNKTTKVPAEKAPAVLCRKHKTRWEHPQQHFSDAEIKELVQTSKMIACDQYGAAETAWRAEPRDYDSDCDDASTAAPASSKPSPAIDLLVSDEADFPTLKKATVDPGWELCDDAQDDFEDLPEPALDEEEAERIAHDTWCVVQPTASETPQQTLPADATVKPSYAAIVQSQSNPESADVFQYRTSVVMPELHSTASLRRAPSTTVKEGTPDEAGGYGLKPGSRADTRMKTAKASRNTKEQMKVTKHKESRNEQRLASLASSEQDLED